MCLRGVKPAGQGQLAKLVRSDCSRIMTGWASVSKATVEFHYAGVAVLVNHSPVEKPDVGMAVTVMPAQSDE